MSSQVYSGKQPAGSAVIHKHNAAGPLMRDNAWSAYTTTTVRANCAEVAAVARVTCTRMQQEPAEHVLLYARLQIRGRPRARGGGDKGASRRILRMTPHGGRPNTAAAAAAACH